MCQRLSATDVQHVGLNFRRGSPMTNSNRTILAIDPGKMTGWAHLGNDGELKDMGQVPYDELHPWLLRLHPADIMVIENFRIRPGHNFTWQEMDTIKVIGACEFRAYLLGMEVVKQEPASYRIGAKWGGIKIPKDHSISHQAVAYAHAVYYSVKVLGRPVPALRLMQADMDAQSEQEG